MIKVLDLFAGTQSVKNALNEFDIDYKGIDIYSPEGENIILDLTQDNIVERLLEKLGNWKPDFIWASPVCNKFSLGSVVKGGGNICFEVKENKLVHRTNWNFKFRKIEYSNREDLQIKARKEGELALKMFENTKKIINHFNVPFAIENPAYAYSRYIMTEYVANICNYCMYGLSYKKATTIYSNIKLSLLKCNHKGLHDARLKTMDNTGQTFITNYIDRARVPANLIYSVFLQLLGGGTNA